MTCFALPSQPTPPRNLCELMLRDVSSLLLSSQVIGRSLDSLRGHCASSPELTKGVNAVVAACEAGEWLLHNPLADSGAVLPSADDTMERALLNEFLARLPRQGTPGVMAAEVAVNLRLLVQHIELKTRLVGEEAELVGQQALCDALMKWMKQWRACSRILRAVTIRARARAYIADLGDLSLPKAQMA
jgi:hypothetical protein